MQKPVVTFSNVSKNYDLRLLYKNVSFCLYPKQTVLVTGKNGSGKSTLLKMLAGLTPASKGSVECAFEKEGMGYLGHQTFIYPHLSAYENLRFWSKASGRADIGEKEILAVLKRVFLDKFSHDNAGIFSRGMAQRLNIARIILQNPKILLLDEPSTGLDRESKELFYQIIGEFQAKNACILWVSHSPAEDSLHATHRLHIEKQQITLTEIAQNPFACNKKENTDARSTETTPETDAANSGGRKTAGQAAGKEAAC